VFTRVRHWFPLRKQSINNLDPETSALSPLGPYNCAIQKTAGRYVSPNGIRTRNSSVDLVCGVQRRFRYPNRLITWACATVYKAYRILRRLYYMMCTRSLSKVSWRAILRESCSSLLVSEARGCLWVRVEVFKWQSSMRIWKTVMDFLLQLLPRLHLLEVKTRHASSSGTLHQWKIIWWTLTIATAPDLSYTGPCLTVSKMCCVGKKKKKKMSVFWDVAPCSLANRHGDGSGKHLWNSLWTNSTRLYGATSQKTVVFTPAAVRARNATFIDSDWTRVALYGPCRVVNLSEHSRGTAASGHPCSPATGGGGVTGKGCGRRRPCPV
jgi:hypothetical protein